MGDIINFEGRGGWVKNVAATRHLAEEFVGPISNKISDDGADGDYCVMDPTNYPDPSLADYVASAGYPKDDGPAIEPAR